MVNLVLDQALLVKDTTAVDLLDVAAEVEVALAQQVEQVVLGVLVDLLL
jgi:hypothetical protein